MSQPLEALVKRGQDAYRHRNFEQAVRDFAHIVELEPNESGHWAYLGLALEWTGAYEKAEQALDEAIKLDPEEPHYFFFRGQTKYLQQKYQAAIDDFKESYRLDDDGFDYVLFDLFLYTGKCFEALGQYEQAMRSYELYGAYIHHPEESKPHIRRVKGRK
jgi:tetratricopeptide (TPR) repeat protein